MYKKVIMEQGEGEAPNTSPLEQTINVNIPKRDKLLGEEPGRRFMSGLTESMSETGMIIVALGVILLLMIIFF